MRLARIKTIKEANEYYKETYRKKHNEKYAIKAKMSGDLHRQLTEEERKEFKRHFALESKRKLRNDGTIWFKKKIYQIKKGEKLYRGKEIKIMEAIDGEVRIKSGEVILEVERVKAKV